MSKMGEAYINHLNAEEDKRLDTAKATFAERQRGENKGERLFEEYCQRAGLAFYRMGFDEKRAQVPNFHLVHPLLRSLPDYILEGAGSAGPFLYYIQVKGTPRIKVEDLNLYEEFEWRFCTKGTALRVAFCFEGHDPFFFSMEHIREMTAGMPLEKFPDNGKEYYTLKIGA